MSSSETRACTAASVVSRLVDVTESVVYQTTRPLEPVGLSLPQYHVLRILRDAQPDGLLVHEVGSRLVARAPNITRLVDKLETKAFVERSRSDSDRRTVRLAITADGLELLETLDGPMEAAVSRAMGPLSDSELDQLRQLLEQVDGTNPGTR
ncbi:MAG: MarR family transcriptional regulator [Candidatus Eisenbacteria bacterium]|uniref:MarR family transcriptional regulator n=1 Tax=Eiseniibacteriota bacterium TaxID=2212470 RepID=A0A956NCA6_UNCEI|nr:MarR family transcriptional regulator [Candidatus Eisenbacteria bacterium]